MDLPETFHIGFGDGDDLNLVLMLGFLPRFIVLSLRRRKL